MRFITDFHNNGILTKGLNHSFVSLIQKKEGSTDIRDFRPISLIGGPYKILSKLLANRLGKVMGKIISKEQSAFVKGQQILDCIVSLNCVFESARRSKLEGFCYKIDFAKAYDSIEWSFLWDMLQAFGFSEKWISWMRECVESAHANVLVNGSPSGDFELGRGLRQGDPLSPFLFIIAAESIGMLLKKATRLGLYDPLEVAQGASKVSHLQFADDTIFLGKASLKNAIFLKRFLILLELVARLRINRSKCQVISIKVESGPVEDMATILGCASTATPFNYLGIQVGCSHKKSNDWKYVIDKIRDRLRKWNNLKISLAGRITLVNAVLSAVPLYALSVFRAPTTVLRKIISLQQKFLWGGREGQRRIVWVKWEALTIPKVFGGLGLRDLKCLNRALMGKWGWRAIKGEEALWVELAVGKDLWDRRGPSGAGCLRSERKIRGWWGDVVDCLSDSKGEWFMNSMRRCVGDGERTSFWDDCWASDRSLRYKYPRLYDLSLDKESTVREVGRREGDRWEWGWAWRRELRAWEVESLDELGLLIKCREPHLTEADRWNWQLEAKGTYSVRSSYRLLVDREAATERSNLWWTKQLWNSWAIPKAKATAWRVIIGRIATKVELAKRNAIVPISATTCPLCSEEEESVKHLFFECTRSWESWARCLEWLGVQVPLPGTAEASFSIFCHLSDRKGLAPLLSSIWICMVWNIWKKRNDIVFNNGRWDPGKLIEDIKTFVWSWGAGRRLCRDGGLRFREWCKDCCLHRLEQV